MSSKKRRIHLVGIGGAGLSAIALVLLERGTAVSGSDRQRSPLTERVQQAGAEVFIGHRPENIAGADLVIRSSAIADDNPEIQAADAAGIPVLKRVDFLSQLTAGSRTIAIAGTHGKTTTTAMIAWMLTQFRLDPSYIIGGVSLNLGANAHSGKGEYFVIEADEYDRMFMGLNPTIAVVTNIEHDHQDYYPTPQDYYQAFQDFATKINANGTLLVCGDDGGAARLGLENTARLVVGTYGISAGRPDRNHDFTYSAQVLQPNQRGGFTFLASGVRAGHSPRAVQVSLQVPGEHNVRNALAVLAVADLLDLSWERAAEAIGEYAGTGRRFEVKGEAGGVLVIDDYAHHPTEIKTTLAAARMRYPERVIWAVWQPHTYTRTRALLHEFAAVFGSAAQSDVDHVLVTEIYAAREAMPADQFSSERVLEKMNHPDAHFIASLEETAEYLLAHVKPGDVVLVMSAGDADWVGAELLANIESQRSPCH